MNVTYEILGEKENLIEAKMVAEREYRLFCEEEGIEAESDKISAIHNVSVENVFEKYNSLYGAKNIKENEELGSSKGTVIFGIASSIILDAIQK